MALKNFLNKIRDTSFTYNYKKNDFNIFPNFKLIIYPTVLIFTVIIYFITYNSINNQKIQNEKNLEIFLNSKDFTVKEGFFLKALKARIQNLAIKLKTTIL